MSGKLKAFYSIEWNERRSSANATSTSRCWGCASRKKNMPFCIIINQTANLEIHWNPLSLRFQLNTNFIVDFVIFVLLFFLSFEIAHWQFVHHNFAFLLDFQVSNEFKTLYLTSVRFFRLFSLCNRNYFLFNEKYSLNPSGFVLTAGFSSTIRSF